MLDDVNVVDRVMAVPIHSKEFTVMSESNEVKQAETVTAGSVTPESIETTVQVVTTGSTVEETAKAISEGVTQAEQVIPLEAPGTGASWLVHFTLPEQKVPLAELQVKVQAANVGLAIARAWRALRKDKLKGRRVKTAVVRAVKLS